MGGLFLSLCGTTNGAVIYVDHMASGANNGSTWSDAYGSLQDALDAASFGDEIWVTTGEHRPTRQADTVDPTSTTLELRDATFWLPRGVQLYGGFVGTETTIDQRETSLLQTILSGDIGVPGDSSDNCYRVVYYRSVHGGGYGADNQDQSIIARIDGFKIVNANADNAIGAGVHAASVPINSAIINTRLDIAKSVLANNSSAGNGGGALLQRWAGDMSDCEISENYSGGNGGGMYLSQVAGSRSIIDTIFSNNIADKHGGGLCRIGDGPAPLEPRAYPLYILNCKFTNNNAGNYGGGIAYRSNVSGVKTFPLAVANCEFTKNTAGSNGGGLYLWEGFTNPGSTPGTIGDVQSSTFGHNVAGGFGGGVYAGVGPTLSTSAELSVENSILWGNIATSDAQANSIVGILASCIEGGGWPLLGNITTDPLFYNSVTGDYTLLNGSPAADSGWNTKLPPDVADLDADLDTTESLPVDYRYRQRRIDAGVPNTGMGTGSITDMGAYELCSGDFNRDGHLNFLDVSLFLSAYSASEADADINGDGSISNLDFSAFLTAYQSGC